MSPTVLANVASTLSLTGMIWTIQTVHYPGFAEISEEGFATAMAAHQQRITALIAIPWAVQGLTSLALVASPPAGVPRWLPAAGLAAAGVTVLSTVALSVPLHGRLSGGPDPEVLRALVRTNWPRTIAWTVHAGIALVIAHRASSSG